MINRYHIYFFAIVLACIGFSCDSDDTNDFFVEDELQVYFDRFVEEGELRGVVVDYDSIPISARFTSLLGRNILGSCEPREDEFNRILINLFYWEGANELDREFLVFHELGHCYLMRPHLELAFPNRVCQSIMASGTGTCVGNYNRDTRSDYLDELFGQ